MRDYLFSLDTYKKLRAQRAALHQAQKPVTASALALTLEQYSERGNAYVQDLLGFIKHNQSLMQGKPQ